MRASAKGPKEKRPFGGNYRTYDTSQGFGNPNEWRAAFEQRMGLDKAKETLGDSDPYVILGVNRTDDWKTIKLAHRAKARATHPDLNPGIDPRNFHLVQAAYETIEEQRGEI
jgi:DnaJ-class molecular chaperone